jgi:protein-disulfide isomerase
MTPMPLVDPAKDHLAGRPDAAIVLVEYGDFQCPYCGAAFDELKQVQQAMGERLCLVFRHFPLTQMHEHALRAAMFAEAAATIDRFWQMHDLLFSNQDALDEPDLVRYARQLGMGTALIDDALGNRFEAGVRQDFRGGVRCGVNGTPSLFINGLRFDEPARADTLLRAFAPARQRHY